MFCRPVCSYCGKQSITLLNDLLLLCRLFFYICSPIWFDYCCASIEKMPPATMLSWWAIHYLNSGDVMGFWNKSIFAAFSLILVCIFLYIRILREPTWRQQIFSWIFLAEFVQNYHFEIDWIEYSLPEICSLPPVVFFLYSQYSTEFIIKFNCYHILENTRIRIQWLNNRQILSSSRQNMNGKRMEWNLLLVSVHKYTLSGCNNLYHTEHNNLAHFMEVVFRLLQNIAVR